MKTRAVSLLHGSISLMCKGAEIRGTTALPCGQSLGRGDQVAWPLVRCHSPYKHAEDGRDACAKGDQKEFGQFVRRDRKDADEDNPVDKGADQICRGQIGALHGY